MIRFALTVCAVCVLSVVSLANRAEADPVGGAKAQWDVVQAWDEEIYTLPCRGGETTAIRIAGDGDTDLDLYVYDSRGNLVASSEGWSDRETVYVTLRYYSETLTIVVKNRGPVYNEFHIEAW